MPLIRSPRHAYPGFSGIIYPGFSRDPRKHWAKIIFGRVQNRSRLSVRAVRAFGRDTKTDDAGAAAQPKRRGRGAVRRANGLSADSTLDFRCRFARHRASPASFRPSGRPRAVGHETLRVTKGHENARPSVVSDNRRCQASQAASGNANSSLHGAAVRLELRLDEPDLCGVDFSDQLFRLASYDARRIMRRFRDFSWRGAFCVSRPNGSEGCNAAPPMR